MLSVVEEHAWDGAWYLRAFTDDGWVACDVSADGTGGLNRSGSLVVHVPEDHVLSVVAGRSAGWLRARVTEPEEGQPPYSFGTPFTSALANA